MKIHGLVPAFFLLLIPGCSLVELNHSEDYTSSPAEEYEVLSQGSPVLIRFVQDVDQYSVEQTVSIKDHDGKVDVKILWEDDRTLTMFPLSDPVAGLEYHLEFNGYYTRGDGKSVESKLSLPFYWVKSEFTPLRILSFWPSDGTIVSENAELVINFSNDVDEASLVRGLSISPDIEMNRRWSDHTLLLSPVEDWENLTTYTVKMTDEVKNSSGTPLFPSWESSFYVQYGTEIPSVLSVGSCSRDGSTDFEPLEGSLTTLTHDQALRIHFSQPMDHSLTESAFTLTPSLTGDFFWSNDPLRTGIEDLVFLPRDGFRMSQSYRLRIASSAQGNTGITMSSDFYCDFTPAIEEQSLLTLECLSYGGFTLNSYNSDLSYDLPAGPVSPFSLSFRFTFSRPFTSDLEKQNVQTRLNIFELFSSGGSPRAGLFSWTTDTTMTVLFSGFNADALSDYYYILELPGGEGGIVNDEGSFFPEDVRQLFRVARL